MISSRLFVAALLLLPPSVASAQRADTVRLSVTDALTRVLRESDEIRIGQAQYEVTGAQVTQARASGLPALNLRGSYTQQTRNARATIVSGSGQSSSGAIDEPRVMLIDCPWCSVRHHSTE